MEAYTLPNPCPDEIESTAAPEAVVPGPNVRFSVLTPRLLRLEYSPAGRFEDRPSQIFWYRRQAVPAFRAEETQDEITIDTGALRLRYAPSARGFTRRSLSVEIVATGTTWRFGERDRRNLLGTARTLDSADGEVPLSEGLVSRSGWAAIDDSDGLVFNAGGWLEARDNPGAVDLYFFGYGHDYLAAVQDFGRICGPTPLVPRWVLGNWWSRYWAYSQDELTGLMADFRAHDVPLAVCVIDMDWHITDTGNTSSGWTGYTWNRELFPEPQALLDWLHAQGLKATLNLHPAAGIHPHEEQYPEMCARLGVDPASGEPIPFDLADPHFAAAYFEVLHHPYEAQGVDFWWIDWQQGERTRLAGLDPLWWLNHLHFYDLARDKRKRPFIFSRWGGLNSRYAIGFSGDTYVTWNSLGFQPRFTATAANVAYGWWSHDIGGHQRGIEDDELYTRWVQYGVFSPILRLHSTNNPYHERRPWGHDAETFRITRAALQLRHALIPYLYSMAWRTAVDGRPLILPMYYSHPEEEEAYHCANQYWYGSELVAAPFVAPRDSDTRLSRQNVWLPDGDWFDFFTGESYAGGRWVVRYGALDEIPVFAKAGAIVPLGPRVGWGGLGIPEALDLYIFPGADNEFALYEDDGETQAHRDGEYAVTYFTQTWRGGELVFRIAPVRGACAVVPAQRTYRLRVRGLAQPDAVRVTLNGAEQSPAADYDCATGTLALGNVVLAPADELVVTLSARTGTLIARPDRRLETCRKLLRAFRVDTEVKRHIDDALPEILSEPRLLMRYARELTDAQVGALRQVIEG